MNPTVSATAQQAHVYVMDELDLWSKNCVEVDYVDATSSQITTLYIAGEVNFGQLGAGPVGPLLAQGVPVQLNLVPNLRYPYAFFVDPSISSWEDLEGQPIAITGELGSPHRAVLSLMEEEGVDSSKHTFITLNSFTNMIAAAQSGQVKAMAAGLPQSNVLRDLGWKEFAKIAERENLNNPAGVVGGDPEWIAENKQAAKGFVKAWLEGVYVMFTDPDLAKKVLGERLKITDADELDQAYQSVSYIIRYPEEQCDNADYYELFKTNYPKPEEIKDPNLVKPDYDICAELESEGFFDQLEDEYGPLPAKPATSGI